MLLCHSLSCLPFTNTQTTSNYLNVCNSQDRIAIYEQAVEKSVVIDDGAMCVCAFAMQCTHRAIINHSAHAYDRWTASRHNLKKAHLRTYLHTGLRMNDSLCRCVKTQCLQCIGSFSMKLYDLSGWNAH